MEAKNIRNREIGFRIWNKSEKMFSEYADVDPYKIQSVNILRTVLLHPFGFPVFVNENGGTQPFDEGRFVIQQYTGIKDKNGREVYEGDILDLEYFVGDHAWGDMTEEEIRANEDLERRTHVVEVKQSRIDGVNLELAGKHEAGEICFPLSYIRSSVILGNILENPELLK